MSADISGSPTDTEPDISSLKLKTASKQTLDDRNTSNSSSSNLDLSDSTNEVSSEKSFFKKLGRVFRTLCSGHKLKHEALDIPYGHKNTETWSSAVSVVSATSTPSIRRVFTDSDCPEKFKSGVWHLLGLQFGVLICDALVAGAEVAAGLRISKSKLAKIQSQQRQQARERLTSASSHISAISSRRGSTTGSLESNSNNVCDYLGGAEKISRMALEKILLGDVVFESEEARWRVLRRQAMVVDQHILTSLGAVAGCIRTLGWIKNISLQDVQVVAAYSACILAKSYTAEVGPAHIVAAFYIASSMCLDNSPEVWEFVQLCNMMNARLNPLSPSLMQQFIVNNKAIHSSRMSSLNSNNGTINKHANDHFSSKINNRGVTISASASVASLSHILEGDHEKDTATTATSADSYSSAHPILFFQKNTPGTPLLGAFNSRSSNSSTANLNQIANTNYENSNNSNNNSNISTTPKSTPSSPSLDVVLRESTITRSTNKILLRLQFCALIPTKELDTVMSRLLAQPPRVEDAIPPHPAEFIRGCSQARSIISAEKRAQKQLQELQAKQDQTAIASHSGGVPKAINRKEAKTFEKYIDDETKRSKKDNHAKASSKSPLCKQAYSATNKASPQKQQQKMSSSAFKNNTISSLMHNECIDDDNLSNNNDIENIGDFSSQYSNLSVRSGFDSPNQNYNTNVDQTITTSRNISNDNNKSLAAAQSNFSAKNITDTKKLEKSNNHNLNDDNEALRGSDDGKNSVASLSALPNFYSANCTPIRAGIDDDDEEIPVFEVACTGSNISVDPEKQRREFEARRYISSKLGAPPKQPKWTSVNMMDE